MAAAHRLGVFLSLLLAMLFTLHASLDKIHIDTTNRLYRSVQDGRVQVLHGLAIEDSSPPWTLATYTDEQIELMKKWGLNVVRMGFQWHMVEPTKDQYNETYIQTVVDFINKLNAHDVYVILDMHQDCWSPLFCDNHGIPSQYSNGYSSDYSPGGSKAYPQPVVTPTYDHEGHMTNCDEVGTHVFGWATCYETYAVGAAAQRLYDNDEGILDRFGKFWQMIASKVKDYPNVLGYEVINEPWLGDVPLNFEEFVPTNKHWDLWFPKMSDSKNMAPMYKKLHDYIREVDNDTIIFFEPATGGNMLDLFPVGFEEGPGGLDYNDRQALSYHVYCVFVDSKKASNFLQYLIANLSIKACDALNDVMYDVRMDDATKLNLAGFLTEFGNAGEDIAAADTIDFAASKMDEFRHGWTYWYLTPDPKVQNSSVIRSLARPYPHRIAGVPITYSFDPKTRKFVLEYVPCEHQPCASKPTEIFTSKNYWFAGGIEYTIHTRNAITNYTNDTTQMWYLQVDKVFPGESILVTITGVN